MFIMYSLLLYLSSFIRSTVKWFLRKTTGLCELQRICYGTVKGPLRTSAIERSLRLSVTPVIIEIVRWLDDTRNNEKCADGEHFVKSATVAILRVKKINPNIHPQFIPNFTMCLKQIVGYQQLILTVETLRKTAYDADDLGHERKLYALWQNLKPDEPLQMRITKQWQDIGFQGDDPKTDFRGMGLLGLENLLYFVSTQRLPASHVFLHSQHPVHGYSFAVVGINLTYLAWNLLKNNNAKTYFYKTCLDGPDINNFHEFYSFLFYEFDRFWMSNKPKNIMEFPSVREKFEINIISRLQNIHETFSVDVAI